MLNSNSSAAIAQNPVLAAGKCRNRHCDGCPINIHTEYGEQISNYGCLPCYADAIQWYKETGKVWACHEAPTKPCLGFLILAKEKKERVSVNKNTILITEKMSLEEIYGE